MFAISYMLVYILNSVVGHRHPSGIYIVFVLVLFCLRILLADSKNSKVEAFIEAAGGTGFAVKSSLPTLSKSLTL